MKAQFDFDVSRLSIQRSLVQNLGYYFVPLYLAKDIGASVIILSILMSLDLDNKTKNLEFFVSDDYLLSVNKLTKSSLSRDYNILVKHNLIYIFERTKTGRTVVINYCNIAPINE